MLYISHNSVIVCKPRSCSNTNRILSSTTLLAFQGISSFYTPRQLEVSGMSPVQSVNHVPGLYQKLAQPGRAGETCIGKLQIKDGAKRLPCCRRLSRRPYGRSDILLLLSFSLVPPVAHQAGPSAFRSPKIAEPMRTSVAPSSTATSKSWLMPMDSTGNARPSRLLMSSRSSRNLRK